MLNPLDLSGRTIMVTGASSGIGREVCVLLSELGARVILVARDAQRLHETLGQLLGEDHRVAEFDLNEVDRIPQWMKALAAETGPLSGLVHSAGVQVTLPVRLLDQSITDKTMRINVYAALGLVRGIRQKEVRSSSASVVLLSSVMGLVGAKGVSAYAASKGAIEAITRSLALELAQERIRVNSVAPAYVNTEMAIAVRNKLTPEQQAQIEQMHPLGIGNPRDVANAVAFLLADTARWITGTSLVVDGGYTAQ